MVMGEGELKYSRNFGNFREFGRESRDMTWDHQAVLNLALVMPRVLIFDSNVEAGMPSFAAAPELPDKRPFASARAAPILSRSWSKILLLRAGLWALEGGGFAGDPLFVTGRNA